jgi:hypothetical protein
MMAKHNRIDDQPPIGMLPDGALNIVQPGAPAQKLRILGSDGTEYAPEDFGDTEASDSFIKAKFTEAQILRRANERIIRERRQRSTGTGRAILSPSRTKE